MLACGSVGISSPPDRFSVRRAPRRTARRTCVSSGHRFRGWVPDSGSAAFPCPDFRVTTSPARSSTRRCFITPKRDISSSDSNSVNVRPSRANSRSSRNRRVVSASALKVRSSSLDTALQYVTIWSHVNPHGSRALLGRGTRLGAPCFSELDIHPPNELLRRLSAIGNWIPDSAGQIRSQHLVECHALRNRRQHAIARGKDKVSLRDDRVAIDDRSVARNDLVFGPARSMVTPSPANKPSRASSCR